jgi:hypothetical protein
LRWQRRSRRVLVSKLNLNPRRRRVGRRVFCDTKSQNERQRSLLTIK